MSGYDPDGLIGYLEEISIESGAEVAVKVSCRPPSLVRAKAVRIIGPHVIDLADSPRSVFEGAPRELRPAPTVRWQTSRTSTISISAWT